MRRLSVLAAGLAVLVLPVLPARAEENVKAHEQVEFARDQVYPALVNISVVSLGYSGGRTERFPSAGSGVIVSPAGHVLTNYHVAGDSSSLVCRLPSKEAIEAEVVAHDPLTDLSVLRLKLETRKDKNLPIPFARIGDSSKLAVGEPVLAMGNPLTLSSSMTLGIVGNPSRVFTSFTGSDMDEMDLGDGQVTGLFTRWIQHDALILPGNSGGPLVNLRGEVVGINELGGSGVGFAIPSNLASHVLNQALTYGEVRRGWFGVTLYPVEKMGRRNGVLVSSTQPGGPADKAGVVPGDVILSLDGRPADAVYFEDVPTLYKAMADFQAGQVVTVRVLRNGKEEKDLPVTVVRMEKYLGDEHEVRPLGLSVREITGPMALFRRWEDKDGVLVTGVRPGFPADDAKPGAQGGDVIRELDGKKVTDFASFKAIADALGKRAGIRVRIRRGNDDIVTVFDTSKKPPESLGAELPKAWLGVQTQVVTPDVATALGAKDLRGFRVTQVYPGTEAAKAGIKVGDVLTAMNGSELKASRIQDAEVLRRRVEAMSVGESAKFKLVRDGAAVEVDVVLQETPNAAAEAKSAADADLEYKVRSIVFFDRVENRWPADQGGVIVTEATRGGWANLAGLQGGDLILRIQEEAVDGIPAFEAMTKKLKEAKPEIVSVFVRRGYRTAYVFIQPRWKEGK
ncbi:MAG: PDZ domain-containing protein [Planctomycetes bacterium]|nr:PDZ domain-containing protein [Planctomycetota bacterium]